jgi:hypothetical protein
MTALVPRIRSSSNSSGSSRTGTMRTSKRTRIIIRIIIIIRRSSTLFNVVTNGVHSVMPAVHNDTYNIVSRY